MPRDAVIRATTRLRNQRMLVRTAYRGLWNDGEVKSGMVELMKFPLIARLVIWFESCTRIWFVSSSGCCCKFLYDSMMNAVMTAENRPAYSRLVSRPMDETENLQRQGVYRYHP